MKPERPTPPAARPWVSFSRRAAERINEALASMGFTKADLRALPAF
jgi:hypothetical protein